MTANHELAERAPGDVAAQKQKTQYYRPAVDVSETSEGLILRYDMPGVAKDSVDISIDKGTLSVIGKAETETEGKAVYRETHVGDYRRDFTLPEDVDPEKVTAEMKAGVLTIHIGKPEKAKPHRIAIATSSN